MKNLRNLFLLALASSALAFAGCDDDDNDNSSDAGQGAGNSAGAGNEGGGNSGGTGNQGAGNEGGAGAGGAGNEGGAGAGGAGNEGGAGSGGSQPVDCEGKDTDKMGAVNSYGPTARISKLTLPATAEEATAGGCNLVTAKKGSQLSAVLTSLRAIPAAAEYIPDDLSEVVTPDEDGLITAIILGSLKDWAEGKTAGETEKSDYIFYVGQQKDDLSTTNFLVDKASFTDGDATNAPLINFADSDLTCQMVRTPASKFGVTLPIMGQNFYAQIDQASINGDIAVDGAGYKLTNGALSGYLTRDTLKGVIDKLKALCNGEDAPELCSDETVQSLLTTSTDELVTMAMNFVDGSFDTYIAGNDAPTAECDAVGAPNSVYGVTCNALGLCVLVEAVPAVIDGVAPTSMLEDVQARTK